MKNIKAVLLLLSVFLASCAAPGMQTNSSTTYVKPVNDVSGITTQDQLVWEGFYCEQVGCPSKSGYPQKGQISIDGEMGCPDWVQIVKENRPLVPGRPQPTYPVMINIFLLENTCKVRQATESEYVTEDERNTSLLLIAGALVLTISGFVGFLLTNSQKGAILSILQIALGMLALILAVIAIR